MKKILPFALVFWMNWPAALAQNDESLPPVDLQQLQNKIGTLRTTELVMSMSQRSLVMPAYLYDLKGLIARQAYNFWDNSNGEPYVSHLNVYSALHEANKYLDYDSIRMLAYNQVGRHERAVTSIVFGSDPNSYYSSSTDGLVKKWSLKDPKAIPEIVYQSPKIIRSIDVSDDGRWLMIVFFQEGLALVSLDQRYGDEVLSVEDPEPVQTAIFMPSEQKYLGVSRTGELKVKGFRTETKQVGQTESTVLSLEVDPYTGTIYAGTVAGVLEAWDEQEFFGYRLGKPAISSLDISPDGKLLAIGRDLGDAVLWNIEQKRLERVIQGHSSTITDVHFSPDNRQLLTTSRDGTARLWDLSDSRKLPIILEDHGDWVMTGCFDPSGRNIITGSRDRFIRSWPVDPQVLADRVCALVSRNMSPEEWNEFVGPDNVYEQTCPGLE